jgi:hypothetical protein
MVQSLEYTQRRVAIEASASSLHAFCKTPFSSSHCAKCICQTECDQACEDTTYTISNREARDTTRNNRIEEINIREIDVLKAKQNV